MRDFFNARHERVRDNQSFIPVLLWVTLWFGAVIVIGFTFLINVSEFRIHVYMTACLTALIAALFVLITELNHPFTGMSSAGATRAWINTIKDLSH